MRGGLLVRALVDVGQESVILLNMVALMILSLF